MYMLYVVSEDLLLNFRCLNIQSDYSLFLAKNSVIIVISSRIARESSQCAPAIAT